MYDAVMDRITRWVPELKDQLEGYNPRLCRGCDIDGVHVECSFSTRVPGGKASVLPHTNCLLCSEARMCDRPFTRSISAIVRSLKVYCAWREEYPVVYDAAMDRITRWVPERKDNFEQAAAKVKAQPCRGCEIDGVHVECSFSTRVPGGKAIPRAHLHMSCLLCSETRLKSYGGVPLGCATLVRLLKTFYAWREEHPAVYDAAMDRITRWMPELNERAAAKAKVKYKPPASFEERAAADKQQREEQWASAKASRRNTSASPSFARRRKRRDEAPARVSKQVPWSRVLK